MGGNGGRVRKEQAYHIPETMIWYASGLLDPVGMGVRTVEERLGEEEEDEPPPISRDPQGVGSDDPAGANYALASPPSGRFSG